MGVGSKAEQLVEHRKKDAPMAPKGGSPGTKSHLNGSGRGVPSAANLRKEQEGATSAFHSRLGPAGFMYPEPKEYLLRSKQHAILFVCFFVALRFVSDQDYVLFVTDLSSCPRGTEATADWTDSLRPSVPVGLHILLLLPFSVPTHPWSLLVLGRNPLFVS